MRTRQFALQFAGGVLLAFLMMLPHGGARATNLALGVVGLGNGPSNDVLLDANSWFVFPDQSASTMIVLSSNDTSVRTVRVTAQCCFDTRASKNVALTGLDVSLTAPPSAVVKDTHQQAGLSTTTDQQPCTVFHGSLVCPTQNRATALVAAPAAGASLTLSLTVTAHGAVTPGRYGIIVSAVTEDANPQLIANNAGPILNVMAALPVDNAEVPLPCPSGDSSGGLTITATSIGSPGWVNGVPPVEVLILRPLLRDFLFPTKAKNPTQSVYSVGINTLTGLATWNMTIMAPSPPLPPTLTSITILNNAGWDKMLVPYNSSACPHLPPLSPPLPVPTGGSLTATIDLTKANTILLRRLACSNWIGAVCASKDRWDDIVLFSDTNFATLFGGRAVTLDWFYPLPTGELVGPAELGRTCAIVR
jgi:hypothetical protein